MQDLLVCHEPEQGDRVPCSGCLAVPILDSADPEILGTAPPSDGHETVVAFLVRTGPIGPGLRFLRRTGSYLHLLAKEFDWQSHWYLGTTGDLVAPQSAFPELLAFVLPALTRVS